MDYFPLGGGQQNFRLKNLKILICSHVTPLCYVDCDQTII